MPACNFGPSWEQRQTNSSFFDFLFPAQSFWKDAKIADRRFEVMSPKNSLFVGLVLSPSDFSAQHFEIFQNGYVIITSIAIVKIP